MRVEPAALGTYAVWLGFGAAALGCASGREAPGAVAPRPASSAEPVVRVAPATAADAPPAPVAEVPLTFSDWVKSEVTRAFAEHCEDAVVTLGSPWRGRFLAPDRTSEFVPVTCHKSTPQPLSSGPDGSAAGSYPAESVVVVMAASDALERQLLGVACKAGRDFESSWSCGKTWFVWPGVSGEPDVLVRLDEGCSDAGCSALLEVTSYADTLESPAIKWPDTRALVSANVSLVGREVHVDAQMTCRNDELGPSEDPRSCTRQKRYTLRFTAGKVSIVSSPMKKLGAVR